MPDALVAAHTFLLEPWVNLFCLIGALAVFDGDQIAGGHAGRIPGGNADQIPGGGRIAGGRRLAWGGVAFGFAAAIKLWALVPLGMLGLLLLCRPRRLGLLAGGAVAGLAVSVLPFLALAPGQLITDVVSSQFTRASASHPLSLSRLSDLAGFTLFPGLPAALRIATMLAVPAAVLIGYLAVCHACRRPPAALDWYALIGVAAVTGMLLYLVGYWPHYGAVAGPFIALAVALPIGLLRPAEHRHQLVPLIAVSLVAALGISLVGLRQFGAETQLRTSATLAAQADRLIPPGSCVLTNDPSLTVSAGRFTSDTPGCPAMVDSYGTLLAMTGGHEMYASRQVVTSVTALWYAEFGRAHYVWLETGSQGQIPWTPALYTYFNRNFRLIGLVNGPGGRHVPKGGLYARRALPTHHLRPRARPV